MLDMELVYGLVCGQTYRDQRSEEIAKTMRSSGGFMTEAGCGKPITFLLLYRCAECGRFFHLACLRDHFVATGDDRMAVPRPSPLPEG